MRITLSKWNAGKSLQRYANPSCVFRRKLREEEEERERDNPKKKRIIRKKEPINAVSHNEAMYQVIQVACTKLSISATVQEKRLSNKINYDILKEIENDGKADQNGNHPQQVPTGPSTFHPVPPPAGWRSSSLADEERPSTSAEFKSVVVAQAAATPPTKTEAVAVGPVVPQVSAEAEVRPTQEEVRNMCYEKVCRVDLGKTIRGSQEEIRRCEAQSRQSRCAREPHTVI